jgi:DNA-binding beta-propeller fold protein YncE
MNGTTYYYVVTAESFTDGESAESVERSATPAAVEPILYGAGGTGNRLVTIDPLTGLDLAVGAFVGDTIYGMAYDHDTDTLYAEGGGYIQLINQTTGIATRLWIANASRPGLAYDPGRGILWLADSLSDELKTVDPVTGGRTTVGPLLFKPGGLAFDANTGTLYGVSYPGDAELYEIDTTTGVGTTIGVIGSGLRMESLAFDPITDTLYGVETTADTLYWIDAATGAGTPVGPSGSIRVPDTVGLAVKY